MVQFNTRANEILLKLVYYGPGLSGKTTNLQMLHSMCKAEDRGELFSVNTQEDRTLFFDFLPIKLGTIYGNAIHLQVYTVPGQVQYDASRRVVLGGADGVVFVADSSESKMQENVDSLSNLYHNLNANRLNIKEIPFVLQYNKRDLGDAIAVGVMNRRLNFRNVAFFESIATQGVGVLDTFLAIAKETVSTTFRKYHLEKKVKDLDELLNFVDASVRANMKEFSPESLNAEQIPVEEGTVIRSDSMSVDDLAPGVPLEPQDIIEDVLKSNMETARLYSELKQAKHMLEKKVEETNSLYLQLERANQDSLKTRRYLESLLYGVGEGIISFSQDGRIITWNAAAEKMFGYVRSEIVGHAFHSLLSSLHAAELEPVIHQVAKGQIVRGMQMNALRKSGEEFSVGITFSPIRGADERVLAFSALVRSEENGQSGKTVVSPPRESVSIDQHVMQLVPAVFHELSNRLACLGGMREKLQEAHMAAGDKFMMGGFFSELDRTRNLLRPLLFFISPSSMQLSPVNPNQVMQEVIQITSGDALAGNVIVEFNPDPTVSESAMDGGRFEDALLGLLRYCVNASSLSSIRRVRIGTRVVSGMLQMVFQDTGPAIPTPEDDRVFDVANARDGYTLGLCVAAAVVKAHGGRLSVRSLESVGNAFLMEIPIMDSAQMNTGKNDMDGSRILVVDDEELLLECLVDAIQAWGCQATPCRLAADAIGKLQEGSFDLIVSDIRMPGLSGIQFFEWIQVHQPHMTKRIIYTTGDSFDPDTREFLETLHLPHLGKPFDLRRLKDAMKSVLDAV